MNENILHESPVLYCLLDLGIKIDKSRKYSFNVFRYEKDYFVTGSYEEQIIAKEVIAGKFSMNVKLFDF